MNNETYQQKHAQGIGGSEIAAVAGLNPYAGPFEIWLKKKGLSKEIEINYNIERGIYLEPALVDWYKAKTGAIVTHAAKHQKIFRSEKHPLIIATPDGIIHKSSRNSKPFKVLEVKAPNFYTRDQWGNEGTDQIPDHYLPQVHWEMSATGTQQADIAALIDGDLKIYSVPFNQKLFDALLDAAQRFWKDYIEADKQPPIDGSKAAREYLESKYPHIVPDTIQASFEDEERMKRLKEIGKIIKQLDQEKALIQNQLIESMEEHEGLHSDLGKVYYRLRNGLVSWKDLAMSFKPSELLIENFRSAQRKVFGIYLKRGKNND